MYKKLKIHFVGIGGVGMSGIAEVLLNLGYPVSGSDLKSSPTTRRLRGKGAAIFHGHKRSHIGPAEVVVASSAIKKNNPEILEAESRKILIIERAEMLAELMRFSKYGIAVSGTHGKTTTTSLVASLLYRGGLDPTMIIGGRVNSFRSNARLGRGDFMVAEADESDGSFLKLSPTIVVITSIDREHMDFYQNFEALTEAYLAFANKVPFHGAVICCVDHPVVRTLIPKIEKRVITYGFLESAQFKASDETYGGVVTRYQLSIHRKKKGEVELNLPGRHNISNSLAAFAVATELGIPLSKVRSALKEFRGIQRRCEVLYKGTSITVIDDYGHHPEEIKATLKAIRGAYAGRLVTLFQPHRFTRTKDLFGDFLHAFEGTDILLMTDIYPASEQPISGISSKDLVVAIKKARGGLVHYLPKNKKIVSEVMKILKNGDIFLSLGAGDVTQIGHEIATTLRQRDRKR